MTKYYKVVSGDYITGIGTNGNDSVAEITEAEYNNMLYMIRSAPSAANGYQYRLRADTLEWELVKLPPESDEEDATDTEYEDALRKVGVDV